MSASVGQILGVIRDGTQGAPKGTNVELLQRASRDFCIMRVVVRVPILKDR